MNSGSTLASTEPEPAAPPLLSVRDLSVSFRRGTSLHPVVRGVSFDIPRAATVALVGESGAGKSVTTQAILGLLEGPPTCAIQGAAWFDGCDLLRLPPRAMRGIRGARIGVVFQEPMTALDPMYTVGQQIVEAIAIHKRVPKSDARAQAIAALTRVGFPEPHQRIDSYPHELSGGMRQRVLIAMALSCEPSLLIADEPTTAIDATLQMQVLALLETAQRTSSMSVLLIAHDLTLVSEIATQTVVLYAGEVVERGPTEAVLGEPTHPYTRALLSSVPPRTYRPQTKRTSRLPVLADAPPNRKTLSRGCQFFERCPEAMNDCAGERPLLVPIPGSSTFARCLRVQGRR